MYSITGDKGRDPRFRVPPADGHQSTIHVVSTTNPEGRHRVRETTNLPSDSQRSLTMTDTAPNSHMDPLHR
jgi:hypothetical protein